MGEVPISLKLIVSEEGQFCLLRKPLFPSLLLLESYTSSLSLSQGAQDSLRHWARSSLSRSTRTCGHPPDPLCPRADIPPHDPCPQGLHCVRGSCPSHRLREGRLPGFKPGFQQVSALSSRVS